MRTIIQSSPFQGIGNDPSTNARGTWPARWVRCADAPPPPFVTAYRCRFSLESATTLRLHISADERYELFVDGKRVGRGPERGDPANWYFETYDLPLDAGSHVLVARVWSMGTMAPHAQMTGRGPFITIVGQDVIGHYMCGGLIVAPDDPALVKTIATGVAAWEAKLIGGIEFVNPEMAWGSGAKLTVDASRFAWGFERGDGDGWHAVMPLAYGASDIQHVGVVPTHLLTPATLPAMIETDRHIGRVKHVLDGSSTETRPIPVRAQDDLVAEHASWQSLIDGNTPLEIPARTFRRVIVDLENYYCVYPHISVSGGKSSYIRIHWSEGLFDDLAATRKGNRDKTDGKYFVGVGDAFLPDGRPRRTFDTLWWECGRFIEIVVKTGDEPLRIDDIRLRETRYPIELEGRIEFDDARLNALVPTMVRSVQMCAHETYMDCPYYEQMMYVADTRFQALMTYMMTRDTRLPRKALRMFDASRDPSGLPKSRYPSWLGQIIPPFALWHVAMAHDFALWRGEKEFIRTLMPGARGIIEHFLKLIDPASGLLRSARGWFFADWVPDWNFGVPPPGEEGVSGIINWHFVYTLRLIAELEQWLGEPELAARARRLCQKQAAATRNAFWDERRALFADDLQKKFFSEHAQCLAVLSEQIDSGDREKLVRSLLTDSSLARATSYFTHYLFETVAATKQIGALFERLGFWHELKNQGFVTTPEAPEPARSDCHAWGAHPLYHFFASVLGIRPAEMGFQTVNIAPQLGTLRRATGKMAHPGGWIEVEFNIESGALAGRVILPGDVHGQLHFNGRRQAIRPGLNVISGM